MKKQTKHMESNIVSSRKTWVHAAQTELAAGMKLSKTYCINARKAKELNLRTSPVEW